MVFSSVLCFALLDIIDSLRTIRFSSDYPILFGLSDSGRMRPDRAFHSTALNHLGDGNSRRGDGRATRKTDQRHWMYKFFQSIRFSFVLPSIRSFILPSDLPPFCPTVRPSFRPFVRTVVLPFILSSVRPSILLSDPSYVLSSVRPSVLPSVRPSIHPSVHPFIRPSARLSVPPSVHLAVYPALHPLFHLFSRKGLIKFQRQ